MFVSVSVLSSFDIKPSEVHEWMDSMGIFVPPDAFERIINNERGRACLFDMNGDSEESRLLSQRKEFNEKLKNRKLEFEEKNQTFNKLTKENEELLQNIQRLKTTLNEKRIKFEILKLNKISLEKRLRNFYTLRKSIADIIQKKKSPPLYKSVLEAMLVLNDCLKDLINLEYCEENNQMFNSENDANADDTNSKEKVQSCITDVFEKFPLSLIYQALIQQQNELSKSLENLFKSDCTETKRMLCPPTFSVTNAEGLPGSSHAPPLSKEKLEDLGQDEQNNLKSPPDHTHNSSDMTKEDLEMRVRELEESTQKELGEIRDLKKQMKSNLGKIIEWTKAAKAFLMSQQIQDKVKITTINNLPSVMEVVCKKGHEEMQLFVDMPLIALENLTDGSPAYKLVINSLRAFEFSHEACPFTRFVREDSFLPVQDILFRFWQKLRFSNAPHKTKSLMEPNVVTNFIFKLPLHLRSGNVKPTETDEDGDLVVQRRSMIEDGTISIEQCQSTTLQLVGLQVWRGALVLADFILHEGESLLKKQTVLELGSGTGLSGIVAAMFAKEVIFTDIDIGSILELIKANIARNAKYIKAKCSVFDLDFCAHHWSNSLEAKLTDISLIIVADVIYDNDLTEAFVNTLERIMNVKPRKTVYIALEKRYVFTVDDLDSVAPCYEYFLSCLSKHKTASSWKVEYVPIDFPQFFNYERVKELVIMKIS